ncbi:MAG: type II toxin-antitoxin system HicB family antitoxin [Mycoplasmataceae bacterium]|nr:type II toxin-antitoxin system HicB family antitoxin [Mycoplasmataceae bacterium]
MNKKTQHTYPAIIYKEKNTYNIYFPDLEDCLTFGKTIEDAYENAIDALSLYLDGLNNLHSPSKINDIKCKKNEMRILVKSNQNTKIAHFVTKEFAKEVALQLKKKDVSQYKLSKFLDISEGYISKIINGERTPKVELAKQIGLLLEIDYHKYY